MSQTGSHTGETPSIPKEEEKQVSMRPITPRADDDRVECGNCTRYLAHIRLQEKSIRKLKQQVEQLAAANKTIKETNVKIYAKAEQEEEYISNVLLKRIQKLKSDKEMLAQKYEQEEERITNELMRKMQAVQAERDTMNGQMKKENAELIDSLVQTVKKTESELEQTRKVLDRMRKEKIDQENALENEQEMLYNTLGKQMELLNNDKRRMERIIQTAYEKGFVETEVTTPPTMASSSSDPLFVVSPIPYMERPPSSVSPSNNELRTLRYNVRHLQSQVNEYQTMDDQKTSQIRHLQAALAAIAREKDDYVRQMEELNRSFNSRTDNYVAGLLKEDQPMGPPSVPHTPRGMHESVSDMDDASSRGSHRDDFMN